MAKVVGILAAKHPEQGEKIAGVLVKRNFNYHIMAPYDLPSYTDLNTSTVTQRMSVSYTGSSSRLHYYLNQLSGDVELIPDCQALRVFKAVMVTLESRIAIMEWVANPVNDMYADAVLSVILKAESDSTPVKVQAPVKIDKSHFSECLIELLSDMFGSNCVNPLIRQDKLIMTVDDIAAAIDLQSLDVQCEDDILQQMISTAVTKLHLAITPAKCSF